MIVSINQKRVDPVLLIMKYHYNSQIDFSAIQESTLKLIPKPARPILSSNIFMKQRMSTSPMLWGVARRLRFVAVLLVLLWFAVWAVIPPAGA
ncbi:hypothetical protein DBV39_13595 [Orrella marina]|uniref:Uncharacterized protein n=1 Tax=Orrella marina TaxID=2163011 RepID=A0A2R4XLC4_9BURK|nr:hypothetical protein DBV39_13595 [Orrella marina]